MTEQELATAIWNIKEIIRDDYDDAEVENVILPFTVLRRLDCVLQHANSKDIMDKLSQVPEQARASILEFLLKQNGLTFFNTSGLSLEKIKDQPGKLTDNFKTYLEGFTANVRNILNHFVTKTKDDSIENDDSADITDIYRPLASTGLLYKVVEQFANIDLNPDKVSNAKMGTIFEIVIQRSKETTNAKAGQYFTPRDIVHLLVSLVMSGKEKELFKSGNIFSIYDPCCGTGGMLTEAKNYIRQKTGNDNISVNLFGQELNHKTYAIAKSDLLIKGELKEDKQIRQGNTLSDDKSERDSFNFMLANPPFGTDWGKIEDKVKAEHERPDGRFCAGLPSTSDGSLLFLQHMISKMDRNNGSRIGIVLNGSPLFNGDAGSGWSNIRKMLIDRNLLDCIVALPKNLFYGTDITTYLWILDNKRPAHKDRKVLFIDASHQEFQKLLQTNLGKKRFEISADGAADILRMYEEYSNAVRDIVYEKTGEAESVEIAKVIDYDDFLYTNVAVRRPLRLWYQDIRSIVERLGYNTPQGLADKGLQIFRDVAALDGCDERRSDIEFFQFLKDNKVKYTAAQIKQLRNILGAISEDAPEVYVKPLDRESGLAPDSNLSDTEKIPFTEDIDEYFAREVLPFAPDAWMDRSKDKVGCEFPFTKIFYKYRPLRNSDDILAELSALDREMESELQSLKNDN